MDIALYVGYCIGYAIAFIGIVKYLASHSDDWVDDAFIAVIAALGAIIWPIYAGLFAAGLALSVPVKIIKRYI